MSINCPDRLADGPSTYARNHGWEGGGASHKSLDIVWGDDSMMGMALPSLLAEREPGPDTRAWVEAMVSMHLDGFRRYLRDPADGLYYHGYDATTKRTSCCKWSRANGWVLVSMAHVLSAAAEFDGIKRRGELAAAMKEHAASLCARLDPEDGRLHQLVNDSSSFAETSSTALLVWAVSKGLAGCFLEPTDRRWRACVNQAWPAVARSVKLDGSVEGICQGMPIWPTAAQYKAMPSAYAASACGGLGAVLSAAAALSRAGV